MNGAGVAAVARSWLSDSGATRAPDFAPSPWARLDVRRFVTVSGAGSLALVVGWAFTARRVAVDDQLPWLNLAVIGLLAAAMANATFLLRGYRAVRHRRGWVLALRFPATPTTSTPDSAEAIGDLVATAAMTRYHRAGCPFVAGKGDRLVVGAADAHRSAGRAPCPWCAP